MSGRFAGTHAVVTGASSGIGQAIAIALAASGAEHVLVHYRQNRAGADETVEAIRRLDAGATAVAADLASATDVARNRSGSSPHASRATVRSAG